MPLNDDPADQPMLLGQPPVPYIDERVVQGAFDCLTFQRGGELYHKHAVKSLEFGLMPKGVTGELRGVVIGSRGDRYVATVRLEVMSTSPRPAISDVSMDSAQRERLAALTGWKTINSHCSCPVRMQCKHVVALLLESTENALRWALGVEKPDMVVTTDRVPVWRRSLGGLLDDESGQKDYSALALGFEVEGENDKGRYGRWEPLAPIHVIQSSPVRVQLTPLRRGKRENWIKGGLTWRSFEYIRPDLEPRQQEAIIRLVQSSGSAYQYGYGTPDHLVLNRFEPLAWEALARAREAGVTFVPLGRLASIRLADKAEVSFEVRSPNGDEGPLELSAAAVIDGDHPGRVRPLGSNGVISVIAEPVGRAAEFRFHALVGPTASEMPRELQNLLADSGTLTIPASDRDYFFTRALPKLRRVARVGSSDGSVELPAPQPPRLHVTARYTGNHAVTVTWRWEYPETGRTFPLDSMQGAGRDAEFERAVLARVREVWPGLGDHPYGAAPSSHELNDVDTAAFTARVIPALEAMDDVEVQIVGTPQDYRELDAAPQVQVTQTHDDGQNDWFNLGFTVTMDGYEIPFRALFVALARGEEHLLLSDGTFFSLDYPAFGRLRELIKEGEALAEWEPDSQRVSKHQVGFFEDIADAADEVEVDRAWSETVGKLKGLETIPDAPLPAGLRAELRPYQMDGYRYLCFLHSLGLGGLLADDMGLGKTLQALALIQHVHETAEVGGAERRPFLVVAPSSVVSVWRSEAARFTPELRVSVIHETSRKRGTSVREAIQGADLVVTSYAICRIDADEFVLQEYSGLILDEAQFVKNRASKVHQSVRRIVAPFRLAITGTPMENSLTDVWSLFSLTAPGVLGTAPKFQTEFIRPIESGDQPDKIEVLRRRIRPFMLRRTKELVAKDLPEKQEQVLEVELEPAHRRLYDKVLQRERKKVLGLIDDMNKNRFIVFRSIMLLRLLALDPAIVGDGDYDGVPSSKLIETMDRLDEVVRENHRVLVFSQFTRFLGRVSDALSQRGIAYSYLDGTTRDRAKVISEFREGDNPVFLISLKAGGFGLTLTEADYVFLLDPWWNPAAENQAIDRAHRIGQTERVMVYRMVAQDTIEEKVLELQRKKRALFDSLTDDGDAFASSVTADDVRAMFE